jgi:hypothetical protein
MYNPFKPLEIIEAETFTSVPPEFRKRGRTAWSDASRHGATDSLNGEIVRAKLPFAGKRLFGLS